MDGSSFAEKLKLFDAKPVMRVGMPESRIRAKNESTENLEDSSSHPIYSAFGKISVN